MIMLRGTSDSNSCSTKNRTVRRLAVNVRTATNPGAGGLTLPSLENVTVKCTLRRYDSNRKMKERIIFQDSVALLALDSMFFSAIEQLQMPSYMTIMQDGVTTPPRVYGQQLMIDLGSPINLQGMDELILEAVATNGWLTGPASTSSYTANSTIEFFWRDEIGVETFIPLIRSKYIQASQAKVKEDIGDNITSLSIINLQGQLPAGYVNDVNAIITQVSITSDRYKVSDTLDRMLARRNMQFPMQNQAWARANSWYYDLNGEVDGCSVELSLNANLVLTSKNALVWRTYEVDTHTVTRAAAMQAKHERRNTEKLQAQMAG